MNKKKLLICGATGFIGRNIAEYFLKKNEFEIFGTYFHSKPWSHPKVKMIPADLTQRKDVHNIVKGMDIIIQAAATTSGAKEIIQKPYYHVTDNAIMNALLFKSAYDHKVSHVIFFSCSVMYPSSEHPLQETTQYSLKEINPQYFGVAWTKLYNEKMCEFYSRIGKTKYTAIRHSNIYGPYDKFDLERSHVFGATVTKIMTSQNGKIMIWGDGQEERDLLYIDDLIHFVESAIRLQKSPFELVNVGCGYSISIDELVKKIIFHSKRNIQLEHDIHQPTIKTKVCLDSTQAEKKFDWTPQISLDEGIEKTLNWYQHHSRS